MSIADKLGIIRSACTDIKNAIIEKGVTPTGNITTYASAIASIESVSGGGVEPSGTLSITANGVYDVTNYASADVSVSGSGSVTLYRWDTDAPIESNYATGWLKEESYIWYTTTTTPVIGDVAYAQYIKMIVRDYSVTYPDLLGGDVYSESKYFITKWYVGSVTNTSFGGRPPTLLSFTLTCQDDEQNTITKSVGDSVLGVPQPQQQINLSS